LAKITTVAPRKTFWLQNKLFSTRAQTAKAEYASMENVSSYGVRLELTGHASRISACWSNARKASLARAPEGSTVKHCELPRPSPCAWSFWSAPLSGWLTL